MIQGRVFVVPRLYAVKRHKLTAQIFPVLAKLKLSVVQNGIFGGQYFAVHRRFLGLSRKQQPYRQRTRGIILQKLRPEPKVVDIYRGLCVQKYRTEYTAETEEVLILYPCRA